MAAPRNDDPESISRIPYYYVRRSASLPPGVIIGSDEMLVRLVTSFATSAAEVDHFTALCRAL